MILIPPKLIPFDRSHLSKSRKLKSVKMNVHKITKFQYINLTDQILSNYNWSKQHLY